MQFQADLLGIPVIRPEVVETTALGAAYAAGLSVGIYKSVDELNEHWKEKKRWTPSMTKEDRESRVKKWKKAVSKTLNWVGNEEVCL
jgi:glycerol kinase